MSETTNLKLFKNDNPSTNTDEFDIENSLNENWDKLDEEVGNTRATIATHNTELEQLKAENEILKNSLPSGDITSETITLTDSAEMRFKKFDILGNSKQETSTQGKNYFTGNKLGSGSWGEVTYSFDNSIVKINGTTTATGNILLDKSTKVKIPAGTYTYTAKINSGSVERPTGTDFALYLMSGLNAFITGDFATSGITGAGLKKRRRYF